MNKIHNSQKKAQSSLELSVILVFLFIIIGGILLVSGKYLVSFKDTENKQQIDNLAEKIEKEIEILTEVEKGYIRELPIDSNDYEIKISQNILFIKDLHNENKEYQFNLVSDYNVTIKNTTDEYGNDISVIVLKKEKNSFIGNEAATSSEVSSFSHCIGPNGEEIVHGDSMIFYQSNVGPCVSETRVCNNGVLSGTYTETSCSDGPSEGGEWVLVPGNPTLGTDDFYVMKYEAKATTASEVNLDNAFLMGCGDEIHDGGNGCPTDGSVNITSKAASKPLVYVYQTQAQQLCANLGPGYKLITDAEWVTIARNVENVTSNWADGVIGSTIADGGGLKRGNAGILDSGAYGLPRASDRTIDTNPKGMLTLSNGETIWDISGSVCEWVDGALPTVGAENSSLGTDGTQITYEWDTIAGYSNLKASDASLNSANGIGMVFTDINGSFPTGDVHAFIRGGSYIRYPNDDNNGVLSLALHNNPLTSFSAVGFRCTYTN